MVCVVSASSTAHSFTVLGKILSCFLSFFFDDRLLFFDLRNHTAFTLLRALVFGKDASFAKEQLLSVKDLKKKKFMTWRTAIKFKDLKSFYIVYVML